MIMSWTDIETAPTTIADHAGEMRWAMPREEVNALGMMVSVALWEMASRIDEDTCQANGCLIGGIAGNGPYPIGFVLNDDDESPNRGVYWKWTTFVRVGTKVIAVCENCSPTTVYDEVFGS